MWALVKEDGDEIVPSQYAEEAKAAGLKIITWTLERSGILGDGNGGWYYQTLPSVLTDEGDTLRLLDVLAQDVGIEGVFSDWTATVTFYANCLRPSGLVFPVHCSFPEADTWQEAHTRVRHLIAPYLDCE